MKTRLLILAVGVFGVLAFIFASCSARALPAIPAIRNHDARGRYFLPPCPRCGAAPIDIFTGYHCPARHHYETPTTTLAAP